MALAETTLAETTTRMLAERVVLMHQGGWDEIVLVLGPLLIIGVLIVVARKQAPVDDEDEDDTADEDGR